MSTAQPGPPTPPRAGTARKSPSPTRTPSPSKSAALAAGPSTKRRVATNASIAAGIVAILGYVITRFIAASHGISPATSGGMQEQEHSGTLFRDFDRETAFSALTVKSRAALAVGGDQMVQGQKGFIFHEVSGGNRQWVFVWQGSGERNALQTLTARLGVDPELGPAGIDPLNYPKIDFKNPTPGTTPLISASPTTDDLFTSADAAYGKRLATAPWRD